MTALPPTYYLHVWWARRPLVASRAAILASVLPENADRDKFMHVLGIHGDPVTAKARITEAAKRIDPSTGKREDLGQNPYGYERAFKYLPDADDREWIAACVAQKQTKCLDPTAGGGSIPFEAVRLGLDAVGNDLNTVAWLVLKATVEAPALFGEPLHARYTQYAQRFQKLAGERLA